MLDICQLKKDVQLQQSKETQIHEFTNEFLHMTHFHFRFRRLCLFVSKCAVYKYIYLCTSYLLTYVLN